MTAIVVIPVVNWWKDCPRCGVDNTGHGAEVRWFTARRGMCATGHFLGFVGNMNGACA